MAQLKRGPKKKIIDWNTVDKLMALHCTGVEIAGFIDINYETLANHIKELIKPDGTKYANYTEYYQARCSVGKIKLRNLQWTSAEHGNVPMQVFLGKNYLNQTDKQQIDMNTVDEIHVVMHDDDDDEETDDD